MQELRANTQIIVTVGPFVDVGDGFTPQTDITLGGNEAELLKHGSTTVVDISGATWAAVTNCRGYYSLTLTTSHTNTEGLLVVIVQDDSDCLPVKAEFMVLSEAAWDSKYVAKDDGFMDVNIKTVGRTDTQETEANNLESACANYSVTRGLTGTALPAVVAGADGGMPLGDANSRVDVGTWLGVAPLALSSQQVQVDMTAIHGTALTETGGQLAGRFVDFFDQASAVFSVATALSSFKATGFAVASDVTTAHTTTDAAIAAIITALDDGTITLHSNYDAAKTASQASKLLAYIQLLARSDAAIETDNATELTEINADGGSGAGDFSAQTDSGEGNRDRLNATYINMVGSFAAILAMLDDPRAEPGQGDPPVNADLATKIDYLYKNWRNKKDQNTTTYQLYNDAGAVVDQKATVSDDNTTATKGEMGTGP